MDFLRKNFLLAVVFLTGAAVLIIEVVAVRILSPYYGNTIFTVSSVITVILAALSLGYYLGGKLADRKPSLRWFFSIIMLSGFTLLLFHFAGAVILPVFGRVFSLSTGPLASSLALFMLPALLLGTLSPYTIKLQSVIRPEQGIGSTAGKIFFWSTFGSISGSLSAAFLFIPHFGIDRIIIANGAFLFLLGLVPLLALGADKKCLSVAAIAFFLLVAVMMLMLYQKNKNAVYTDDGLYQKITIRDSVYQGRPARFLLLDRSSSGAMWLDTDDPTDLLNDYTKYYILYELFKLDVKRALVIGGGVYSIPKALLSVLPEAEIDVAEIEPSFFELARKYFKVPDTPRLKNYEEDGRRLLEKSPQKYDYIFSDVYYSLFSVPSHFTTREFFEIAREKLSDGGVFIASMIGDLSRRQPSLVMSEIKTFQAVFPNSYFFAVSSPRQVDSQNIVFVGHNSPLEMEISSSTLAKHSSDIIRSLESKVIDPDRFELTSYPLLTDNFSPTEYLTGQILAKSFNGEQPYLQGEEMMALIAQQLRYGPRYLNSAGHEKVQNFLRAEMEALAMEVKTQSWEHEERDGNFSRLTNIIGRLYPERSRRVVLGTHYDSKKFADLDAETPDRPVPGANDSASGVAVLIELARLLADTDYLNVGVDFVFFDGEEGEENQGGDYSYWKPLGSTYFAEHLDEVYPDQKPVGGIVVDMVCDRDLEILREESSVEAAPSQLESFRKIAQKIDSEAFGARIRREIRDDHTPLNRAGIPSFLLIDFEYPYFHTTEDTPDKCSAQSLETVARAVYEYLKTIE